MIKQFFTNVARRIYDKSHELLMNNEFILFLIILNTAVICLQEFNVNNPFLSTIESLFTVFFILEIFFKSQTRTFKVYISTNWNKLDFFLVAISIPSLFTGFIFDLDFLLVFRVFRVFKFFRLLKFFPRIDSVIPGVAKAFKSSYLIFFGFFTMLFIFSILSCSIFKKVDPEHFGTPLSSVFTMFQIFTVEGWNTIPEFIAAHSNAAMGTFARIYFSLLMFVGGVIGLAIVNSIFVDAMVDDNNKGLEAKIEELTKTVQQLVDTNKNKT